MRLGVTCVLGMWCLGVGVASPGASLLLALMVRDEEANLRANLPYFGSLADAVVCGIDDRSSDNSALAIAESLPKVARWVFYFRFDGFGRGRSLVFREAWRKFPHVSHVLCLDPDWVPDLNVSLKIQLDFKYQTFLFKVVDRNGLTSRTMNWRRPRARYHTRKSSSFEESTEEGLERRASENYHVPTCPGSRLTRHEAGLRFKHQLHEQLVQPTKGDALLTTWESLDPGAT